MKARIEREKRDFSPFDLVITIESEQEARQVMRQLDHVTNGDYLTAANILRIEMERQGY